MRGWVLSLAVIFLVSSCQNAQKDENKKNPLIKIAFEKEPTSLDPRKATDLTTANTLHMIYEGLMRIDYHGNVTPGIAESVDISPDQKTYTFQLRNSKWSDGTPLTAYDFEESWKSLLSPHFPAPNAYQFYYIKGAKDYKEGRANFDHVGIKAKDANHLIVELENPTPYFLKLVSAFFYLPTSPQIRQSSLVDQVEPVCNGPYKLEKWKHQNEIVLVRNPNYWDEKVVSIDRIALIMLDEHTSLNMFEMGQLDYVGSPTSTLPQDAIATLHSQKILKIKPAAATHWFRFNTEAYPLNHPKVRKAFNLALDRKAIVEHVTQGNQLPAIGIVPPIVSWKKMHYYKDHDVPAAWELFQQALVEMNIDKDSFPTVKLTYAATDRYHKIAQAVQQQWNHAFGIQVELQSLEPKIFSENVLKGEYQIATGSWYADFSDPINFLEIFKYKTNPSNRTKWENNEYIALLNQSSNETDPDRRTQYLERAEALLMEDMPVAPLFFGSYNYLESEYIGGIGLSDLGILDLKYAFIEDVEDPN